MRKSLGVVMRVSCTVVALVSMSAGCSFLVSTPRQSLSSAPPPSATRLDQWYAFREHLQRTSSELDKVRQTNDFFNAIHWRPDEDNWQQDDYWATPLETLRREGGDCEDLAIAKYFTLRDSGVDPERLRLTYVWRWKGAEKQAHMVLSYLPEQGADPLVLDNLNKQALALTERSDLEAVYSFNEEKLWLAGNSARALDVSSQERLVKWREVNERMAGG